MSQYERDVTHYGLIPNRSDLDCAPLLDKLHEDAAEGEVRKFIWGPGGYFFYTQPKSIHVRGLTHTACGRGASALLKAFVSTNDYGGIFNLDWGATGFRLFDFGIASTAASKGTGSLISAVPSPGGAQALSEVSIENCYLTSEVNGGHKYGIYVDGWAGGTATTPQVRGLDIIRTRVFGTAKGGYAMYFYCCGGIDIDGGSWTPGGVGPDAVVRFDGPNRPDTSFNAQNSIIRPQAAYDLQFGHANNINVDATWIYRIERGPHARNIKVTGSIYLDGALGKVGDWSGKDGCQWTA
jgi:hypothetical protein